MTRLIVIGFSTLLALAGWCAFMLFATAYGWGRPTLAPRGDWAAFNAAAIKQIDGASRGNAAYTLIKGGQIQGEHFRSIGTPVDHDTLFQVASLSKWVTALGVMTLVDAGRLDLDAPVSRYLTRWKLPPSEFDNDKVTLRRILSHTAGFTDGLGYAGFAPGAPIQSLEASLTHAADASPGAGGAVIVGEEPGAAWNYSGGGYTLLQLVVEEVSGEPFNAYMQRAVLRPFGMSRSTFELPDPVGANVAEFFDAEGKPATHFQFTAKAAASLYTTTADLTRLIQAHVAGPNGDLPGRGVLRPETLAEMRKPHAYQYGYEFWGLGVVLYAPNDAGDFIVGHDGQNEPAINTTARFDPDTGDGIVLLETGNRGMATKIASEWVFWKTGYPDLLTIGAQVERALPIFLIGCIAIVLVGALTAWRFRRRVKSQGK